MSEEESQNTQLPEQDIEVAPRHRSEKLRSRRGIYLLAGFSILSIGLAIASGLYWYFFCEPSLEIKTILTPPISINDMVTEFPELASILSDPRLDSVYKDFLIAYQEGGLEAAYALAKKRGLLNKNDDLVLTLELDTTDTVSLQAELESHGIIVTAVSGNLMDIVVPMELIQSSIEKGNPASFFQDIAGLDHVIRIKMPIPFK